MDLEQRILSFGNIVMDGIYHVNELPVNNEKVFAHQVNWAPGGTAVHFANQSAKIGTRASVLGWVGNDSIGIQLLQLLELNGVESSLHHIFNAQTPTSIIMVDDYGEKAVVLSPPMEESRLPAPEEVALYDLQEINHLHTHLFLKPYVDSLLRECRKLGISSSLDIEALSVKSWGVEGVKDSIALATIIFVNESALHYLSPLAMSIEKSLLDLYNLGPDIIICMRGKSGCVVKSEQGMWSYPSIEVATSNSLAAGDIFASVFMNRYVGGATINEAICYATAASAVAISRSSIAVHYPTLKEIEDMLHGKGQRLLDESRG
ncbi:carbohydrate kinase family protein [Paenibacillus endoradicis]|uniref:carbohydrate kinase family protein n=1 Tax=Paenibacillus endoradicis TaxID=2972487 RepID=UPI002158CDBB|nr:carbohydrate kinase family protein [Paenibacillus endoradicis]MCR8657818.1 carbohydrate kinase family protein [Paenibacillus endoradicis]